MKKKALVILLNAIIISVFFCIPVNAQILYSGVARDIDQQGNIIMTTSVNQFDENNTSYHQAYLLVTVQLENISSSPTYVGYARFSFSFPDVDCSWSDFESFSNDAVLTRSVDGQYSSFKVIPNNDFSYNDGIVVPPNSSIYAIGIIGLRNSYDNAPVIQGFTVTNSIGTVATSDNYPYGLAVDYSPLISSLNTYFGTEHTDLTNLLTVLGYLKVDTGNIYSSVDDIEDLIGDIVNLLTYTGSDPSFTLGTSGYNTSYYSNGGFALAVDRFVFGAVPLTYDFELDSAGDDLYSLGYYYYPVTISVTTNCTNNYSTGYEIALNNLFPNAKVELIYSNSDMFDIRLYSQTVYIRPKQSDGNNGYIPKGRTTSIFQFRVYYPNTSTLTFPAFNYSSLFSTAPTVYNGFVSRGIIDTIRQWYYAWIGNSSTNSDINTDSGTLKTESDAVHQQEQAYYTQNQQAIEATGLRNYNFSQSQGDGIARVSLDFTNLWNSLGSFNSVYIFSLTLGLALTILRHAPNAISRIRWKKNQ